jgi:hypothetical protein
MRRHDGMHGPQAARLTAEHEQGPFYVGEAHGH